VPVLAACGVVSPTGMSTQVSQASRLRARKPVAAVMARAASSAAAAAWTYPEAPECMNGVAAEDMAGAGIVCGAVSRRRATGRRAR
jgi:hypothetical protein